MSEEVQQAATETIWSPKQLRRKLDALIAEGSTQLTVSTLSEVSGDKISLWKHGWKTPTKERALAVQKTVEGIFSRAGDRREKKREQRQGATAPVAGDRNESHRPADFAAMGRGIHRKNLRTRQIDARKVCRHRAASFPRRAIGANLPSRSAMDSRLECRDRSYASE